VASPGLPKILQLLWIAQEKKMLYLVMWRLILIMLAISLVVIVAHSLVQPGRLKSINGEDILHTLFTTILVTLLVIGALYPLEKITPT
jgi:hypothetical protein